MRSLKCILKMDNYTQMEFQVFHSLLDFTTRHLYYIDLTTMTIVEFETNKVRKHVHQSR